jgi:ribonuclease R
MKKRKSPYDQARRKGGAEDEPWKSDFVPHLIQSPQAYPPQQQSPQGQRPSARPSNAASADAVLARLKVQPSSLDDLICYFQLSKLPDQTALEKRVLELVKAGQVVLDRRGRLVTSASGVGLPAVPTPLVQVLVKAPPAAPAAKVAAVKEAAPSASMTARAKSAGKAFMAALMPEAKPAKAPAKPASKLPGPVAKPLVKTSARVGLELTGKVSAHRDGFGFVVPEPKLEGGEDVFLPMREMRGLMTGDRVRVRVVEQDATGRLAGEFLGMVATAPRFAVGRLRQDENGRYWLTPDNQKAQPFELQIPVGDLHGADAGQVVRAEMVTPPGARGTLLGRVTEVIGEHLAPGLEIEIALRRHDLPYEWPDDVEAEAKAIDPEVRAADAKGRVDLRELPLVTIDGTDARDFDDAVYAEKTRSGFRLVVAIADVSAYVKPDKPLDVEAQKRGTSVYFPRRVIPMLPEKLSNGLCSLNPKVDRLCMVADMKVSKEGEVTAAKFYEAVMNSKARLIYDDVAAMLAEPKGEAAQAHKALMPHLQALETLFEALFKARTLRGAIDFEGQETKFEFTDDRKIARIVPVVRNKAHRMIEECMIAANVQAAMFVSEKETPALFRVHERPDATRVVTLREFLAGRGLSLGGGELPTAGDFAKVSEQARGRPDTSLIHMMILRTMSQARYAPEALGHFGLALEHYGHFTSPIRRYPDLLLHRAIKHVIARKKPSEFFYSEEQMAALGEHCSMTERRADEATRDVSSWLKCEFMSHHVGETFNGLVSAVTSFGLFVELSGLFIDGLVHISALGDDSYGYDAKAQRLFGKRNGRAFTLGQPLRVQVARVNLEERKIDLVPADMKPAMQPNKDSDRVQRSSQDSRRAPQGQQKRGGTSGKPSTSKGRKRR